MLLALMIAVTFLVGFLSGCAGVGGIILIPALTAFLGMGVHEAMGTALFSFFFLSVIGALLYRRMGHLDASLVLPLCFAGAPCAYAGAVVKAYTAGPYLNLLLGGLILAAGGLILRPARSAGWEAPQGTRRRLTLLVGGSVAFFSAMTGAGGAVLSTPILVGFGVPPLLAIGAGQVYSVVVSLCGSLGNFQHHAIDVPVGIWLTAVEIVGLFAGVRLAHRLNPPRLRALVAWICLATGLVIFVRALPEVVGRLWAA